MKALLALRGFALALASFVALLAARTLERLARRQMPQSDVRGGRSPSCEVLAAQPTSEDSPPTISRAGTSAARHEEIPAQSAESMAPPLGPTPDPRTEEQLSPVRIAKGKSSEEHSESPPTEGEAQQAGHEALPPGAAPFTAVAVAAASGPRAPDQIGQQQEETWTRELEPEQKTAGGASESAARTALDYADRNATPDEKSPLPHPKLISSDAEDGVGQAPASPAPMDASARTNEATHDTIRIDVGAEAFNTESDEAPTTIAGDTNSSEPAVVEPGRRARTPRQYRPAGRAPAVPRASPRADVERETRERGLPVDVRLMFQKAGFCNVSLLPRRSAGMPVELVASGAGNPPALLALQDEWYQDVVLPDRGHLLREGIEWAGTLPDGQTVRWSMGGRALYVLASHDRLNGFVSTPRLVIGEDHVVLCVAERLSDVMDAIKVTGSPEPVRIDSDSGVPAGWIGLRGVNPRIAVAPSADGEILDALRPLAQVEIVLEGGIRLERQTWLSGYPPRIRLHGDASSIGTIAIDGRDATPSADGSYFVSGWDSPGEHTVWCTSGSRSYVICEAAENWEPWDAYTWSLGEAGADGVRSRPAICGASVRPPRLARNNARPVVIPASNPVLIGAAPGEIEFCVPRSDVRTGLCVGFPWFDPIWAVPADALRCDKRSARVLLLDTQQRVAAGERQSSAPTADRSPRAQREQQRRVDAWCAAILTAGRKGLQSEPANSEIVGLWRAYKRRAKGLSRQRR